MVRMGEYLRDETVSDASTPEAQSVSEPAPPIVVVEPEDVQDAVLVPEEPIGSESVEVHPPTVSEEATDPGASEVTDETIEGESHKSWD